MSSDRSHQQRVGPIPGSHETGPSGTPSRILDLGSLVAVLLASPVFGAVVVWVLNRMLDHTLRASTDIIGYPIFHPFNPYIYEQQYQLAVVVFPAVTIGALVALLWTRKRFLVRSPSRPRHLAAPAEADAPPVVTTPPLALLGALARVLTVGLVIGLGAAVGRGDNDLRAIRDLMALALVYVALLAGGAFLLSHRSRDSRSAAATRLLARANAVGGVLSVVGIVIAARVTQVYVSSDGTIHHYDWLSPLFASCLIVGGLAITVLGLRRARGNTIRIRTVERRVVFLVAVPVGLFLLTASLPGVIDKFSAFESGQSLTTLRLAQHGAFPWRDWVSAHGLLDDLLQPLLGSSAIQDSYWGILGTYPLFVVPACVLSVYYLAYRVVGSCWVFLVALGLMLFDHGYPNTYLRFALWPLLLILLGAVIDRRRWWLAMLLGAALAIQAVISQETAYCIAAVGITLLASDASRLGWKSNGDRLRAFAMTVWTTAGGAAVAAVLVLVLWHEQALGDFVRFYTAFVPGHILTGGIPHLPLSGYYLKQAVFPIIAMLVGAGLIATKRIARRPLTTLDWMLMAAIILEFLYYPKLLDRADHVNETFVPAIPLFLILGAALLDAIQPVVDRLSRSRIRATTVRYSVATAAVAAILLIAPVSPVSVVMAAPGNFRVTAASEPTVAALGYAEPGVVDPHLLGDLAAVLTAYMKPGEHLFDFTNEPGLLFYLLDFRPSTSYYEVSVAMRQVIQQDLINRLQLDRPLFVVFAQRQLGLPVWDDIPNMVRHYDISRYLLAHYRPFADIDGQVIYVDAQRTLQPPQSLGLSLSAPVVSTDLSFRGPSCDWGYAPDYLSISPSGHNTLQVAVSRESTNSYALRRPPGRAWHDYDWLEISTAGSFSKDAFALSDRPVPGEQRSVTFATNGGRSSYRFPIAACSQWWGYGTTALHLTTLTGQDITSVRLLP